MSKQHPTYEEIQRKKARALRFFIGAYIFSLAALIAAIVYIIGG
jgi:hypothetical protein